MSVTKHKNGRTYSYRFTLPDPQGGPRHEFRGSTGATTKREAEKVEAAIRAREEAILRGTPLPSYKRLPQISLDTAAARFWQEHGQHLADSASIFGQIGRLVDRLGADTLLSQITSSDLTAYQVWRRGQGVSNRTVNAEVPDLISWIFKRAELWNVELGELASFNWRRLKLGLPQHRTRSANRREQVLLLRKLRPDYRPIIRFALLTGLRRAALLLRKDQVDFDAMLLEYQKKSIHTGDTGWLPITPAMEKILRSEMGKDPDGEWVFTYECRKGGRGRKRGRRYPITYYTLGAVVKAAGGEAGLDDWRPLHDLRHTAATETLKRSRNLKAVQRMLGHSSIGMTSKYTHVMLDDVREAMES